MPVSDHDHDHDAPDPPPPLVPRFKRRKTAHTKRAAVREEVVDATAVATANDDARTDAPATAPPLPAQRSDDEDEEGVPGLREALRRRKRARESREQRGRDGAVVAAEVVGTEGAGGTGDGTGLKRYASRFVKQTGQVVDTGDREMTAYIEARLAEQHHAQYGTPIPAHLAALVGANNTNRNTSSTASTTTSTTDDPAPKPLQNTTTTSTTAARHGKLEEVPLPTPPSQSPSHSSPAPRVRLRRDGTPFPPRRQRRTSADLRRDALVESILSESRIEYFAPPASGSTHNTASETPLTEEQMLQQFEDEYRDAAEARRPNPVPPAGKGAGAGDAAKGPKLGGSRSARAAMAAREKEKDKKNDGLKR